MSRDDEGLYENALEEPTPLHLVTRDDTVYAGVTRRRRTGRATKIVGLVFLVVAIAAGVGYFVLRHTLRQAMHDALPQLDGTVMVAGDAAPFYGLHAPVTVERDARGVPHIHASSMDDLVFAQGYITAQDRLWQMELLRRHAAGDLAQVLGSSLLEHDRLQRTLQIRAAADRAIAVLPDDQMHWLEVYARGVNASMAEQRAHPPLEFRVLQFFPGPWTPRDSLLIGLAMFQDLTTGFPVKLGREALAAHLPPEAIADLYPVGSWRDHWPGQLAPDLTTPQPEFLDIPLDESQTKLRVPTSPGTPGSAAPSPTLGLPRGLDSQTGKSNHTVPLEALLSVERTLALFHNPCTSCVSGSNNWAISGARTASGKPMLSNDMHLSLAVPGLWYEADLDAQNPAPRADFHVAGVTLPGTPFVIVGHNAHVAWGFTNLGADVQDVYIETTRGAPGAAEYQTPDGSWLPVSYRREVIHVRGAADVNLDVPIVRHGDADIPIISGILPGEKRSLSLRWTVYDPANVGDPFFGIDSASDSTTMLSAFESFGGPAQNLVYADDQGHIGYHAVGHIPVRGSAETPAPLSDVPTDAVGPDAVAHEWAGYIPFDELPQAFDPKDGVIATANARVTPEGYDYPITLNWSSPYRTERIYKVLEATPGKPLEPRVKMTPADMLALQTDVNSELDRIVAQHLVYAIDHTTGPLKKDKRLHQAADLMRDWNGNVDTNAPAPAIVDAAREAFWPMVLVPKLAPLLAPELAKGIAIPKDAAAALAANQDANLWRAYVWGESQSVEEQMIANSPARWLPSGYANWEDFLAAVVDRGLRDAHAPGNLSMWQYGKANPVDLEHPIFSRFKVIERLIGITTGTGVQPKSGDMTTIKQVARAFGPSERFTVDFGDLDRTTLNVVLGQSGNVSSPWYMDQFGAWLAGTTYPLPFSQTAVHASATHMLTLVPR